MVNRPADAAEPDDTGHRERLEAAGAVAYRGTARIVDRGRVEVVHDDRVRTLEARHILIAVGSVSRVPRLPGLERIPFWTNEQATLARELPASLVVLGGGPTGCELAQVFARFGVPTTIVQSGPRVMPTDDPRNAAAVEAGLRASGVVVRTGVRATRAVAATDGGPHRIELDDGSTAEGQAILLAVGRDVPLDDLGLEHYGLDTSGRAPFPRDGRLRVADGLWVAGDPAGPELHTHQGHYQGGLAVRMALGEPVAPDYRALPRVTYTDPEAASVGLSIEQARETGLDAIELTADYRTSSKGYATEATIGHVTITVDRASRELVGGAMACPDASAAIHECVLAIKARVPIDVLAETIHAFPSTARILDGLFTEARRELGSPPA
jgi:pyruvate/2-oxoglutarate dehydrogenase complex dihydrolipoamide dehydrogenase (E3) component